MQHDSNGYAKVCKQYLQKNSYPIARVAVNQPNRNLRPIGCQKKMTEPTHDPAFQANSARSLFFLAFQRFFWRKRSRAAPDRNLRPIGCQKKMTEPGTVPLSRQIVPDPSFFGPSSASSGASEQELADLGGLDPAPRRFGCAWAGTDESDG
jgi:hypothetical protein